MTSGVSDRVTSTVVTDMVCMADMAETSMRQNISAAGVHVKSTWLLYCTRRGKNLMVLGHNVHNDGKNQQRCKVLKGAQPVGEVEGLDRGPVEDVIMRMVMELEAMQ